MIKCWVRTLHCSGPQPGDYCQLITFITFQIRPLSDHLPGDLDLGVEVSNTLKGLLTHPVTIATHVLGQALDA